MTVQVEPGIISEPHVRPTGDRIAVIPVRDPKEETGLNARMSEGGIHIPDSVDNEATEYRVVALGDGFIEGCPDCSPQGRQHKFEVQIDDRVLICPWMLVTIVLDDVEYNLASERDVLGIFRE